MGLLALFGMLRAMVPIEHMSASATWLDYAVALEGACWNIVASHIGNIETS